MVFLSFSSAFPLLTANPANPTFDDEDATIVNGSLVFERISLY
jgi:hypothetical protein